MVYHEAKRNTRSLGYALAYGFAKTGVKRGRCSKELP
jgi:hypothetical protein